MSTIYENKYDDGLKPVIGKKVPFVKRVRNRVAIWWLPLGVIGYLGAKTASMFTDGTATNILSNINVAINTGWNYVIGGAIAYAAARFVIFPKRIKAMKRENAIHKQTKKVRRAQKKFIKHKHAYLERARNAERLYDNAFSGKHQSPAIAAMAFKEYKRERAKIDKFQRKLAKSWGKVNGTYLGSRNLLGKALAPVTVPIGLLNYKPRGLKSTVESYNNTVDNFNTKRRQRKMPFGKFMYNGNVLEVQKFLSISQEWLREVVANTEKLDADFLKYSGKEYTPGGSFLNKAFKATTFRAPNPINAILKQISKPVMFSEELYEKAVRSKDEKRGIKEYDGEEVVKESFETIDPVFTGRERTEAPKGSHRSEGPAKKAREDENPLPIIIEHDDISVDQEEVDLFKAEEEQKTILAKKAREKAEEEQRFAEEEKKEVHETKTRSNEKAKQGPNLRTGTFEDEYGSDIGLVARSNAYHDMAGREITPEGENLKKLFEEVSGKTR